MQNKEDQNRINIRRTAVHTFIALVVYTVFCVGIVFFSIHLWKAADPPPANMQEVNGKSPVYGDGIHHLLNATLLYGGKPHLELTTFVNYNDRRIFMDNVQNLAPGLGWYAHSRWSSPRYSHISVIISASELALVESMVADPERWVKRESQAYHQAKSPARIDDLINVEIKIKTINNPKEGYYFLAVLMIVLTIVATFIMSVATVVFLLKWSDYRKDKKENKYNEAQ